MKTKFHTLSWRDASGWIRAADLPRPDYQIGNAKHWTKGLTTDWQIRPVASTDLAPGFHCEPGLWLLGRQIPGVGGVYYTIALPPHLRRNTPQNVRAALKRAMRGRPEAIAVLKKLEAISRSVLSEAMAASNRATLH